MILVTTGTHEQPFDRLVMAADQMVANGHEVVIQYGYSSPPNQARGHRMLPTNTLRELASRADLIITHGGPGSLWDAFNANKIPIAVPRRREFGEHVDDHQVAFVRHLAKKRRVIAVYEPQIELPSAVENYVMLSRECITPASRASENRSSLKSLLDNWLTSGD
jgi:UDP-N-acetylglucosamine transferase subunit ALG13